MLRRLSHRLVRAPVSTSQRINAESMTKSRFSRRSALQINHSNVNGDDRSIAATQSDWIQTVRQLLAAEQVSGLLHARELGIIASGLDREMKHNRVEAAGKLDTSSAVYPWICVAYCLVLHQHLSISCVSDHEDVSTLFQSIASLDAPEIARLATQYEGFALILPVALDCAIQRHVRCNFRQQVVMDVAAAEAWSCVAWKTPRLARVYFYIVKRVYDMKDGKNECYEAFVDRCLEKIEASEGMGSALLDEIGDWVSEGFKLRLGFLSPALQHRYIKALLCDTKRKSDRCQPRKIRHCLHALSHVVLSDLEVPDCDVATLCNLAQLGFTYCSKENAEKPPLEPLWDLYHLVARVIADHAPRFCANRPQRSVALLKFSSMSPCGHINAFTALVSMLWLDLPIENRREALEISLKLCFDDMFACTSGTQSANHVTRELPRLPCWSFTAAICENEGSAELRPVILLCLLESLRTRTECLKRSGGLALDWNTVCAHFLRTLQLLSHVVCDGGNAPHSAGTVDISDEVLCRFDAVRCDIRLCLRDHKSTAIGKHLSIAFAAFFPQIRASRQDLWVSHDSVLHWSVLDSERKKLLYGSHKPSNRGNSNAGIDIGLFDAVLRAVFFVSQDVKPNWMQAQAENPCPFAVDVWGPILDIIILSRLKETDSATSISLSQYPGLSIGLLLAGLLRTHPSGPVASPNALTSDCWALGNVPVVLSVRDLVRSLPLFAVNPLFVCVMQQLRTKSDAGHPADICTERFALSLMDRILDECCGVYDEKGKCNDIAPYAEWGMCQWNDWFGRVSSLIHFCGLSEDHYTQLAIQNWTLAHHCVASDELAVIALRDVLTKSPRPLNSHHGAVRHTPLHILVASLLSRVSTRELAEKLISQRIFLALFETICFSLSIQPNCVHEALIDVFVQYVSPRLTTGTPSFNVDDVIVVREDDLSRMMFVVATSIVSRAACSSAATLRLMILRTVFSENWIKTYSVDTLCSAMSALESFIVPDAAAGGDLQVHVLQALVTRANALLSLSEADPSAVSKRISHRLSSIIALQKSAAGAKVANVEPCLQTTLRRALLHAVPLLTCKDIFQFISDNEVPRSVARTTASDLQLKLQTALSVPANVLGEGPSVFSIQAFQIVADAWVSRFQEPFLGLKCHMAQCIVAHPLEFLTSSVTAYQPTLLQVATQVMAFFASNHSAAAEATKVGGTPMMQWSPASPDEPDLPTAKDTVVLPCPPPDVLEQLHDALLRVVVEECHRLQSATTMSGHSVSLRLLLAAAGVNDVGANANMVDKSEICRPFFERVMDKWLLAISGGEQPSASEWLSALQLMSRLSLWRPTLTARIETFESFRSCLRAADIHTQCKLLRSVAYKPSVPGHRLTSDDPINVLLCDAIAACNASEQPMACRRDHWFHFEDCGLDDLWCIACITTVMFPVAIESGATEDAVACQQALLRCMDQMGRFREQLASRGHVLVQVLGAACTLTGRQYAKPLKLGSADDFAGDSSALTEWCDGNGFTTQLRCCVESLISHVMRLQSLRLDRVHCVLVMRIMYALDILPPEDVMRVLLQRIDSHSFNTHPGQRWHLSRTLMLQLAEVVLAYGVACPRWMPDYIESLLNSPSTHQGGLAQSIVTRFSLDFPQEYVMVVARKTGLVRSHKVTAPHSVRRQ